METAASNSEEEPCRTTQHCVRWGWCQRCGPGLAGAASHIVKAVSAAGVPYSESGEVYGRLMDVLRAAVPAVPVGDPWTVEGRWAIEAYDEAAGMWVLKERFPEQEEAAGALAALQEAGLSPTGRVVDTHQPPW